MGNYELFVRERGEINDLTRTYCEEAYEIQSEDEFNKLEMSIRGEMPEGSGLWKQFIFTFNP